MADATHTPSGYACVPFDQDWLQGGNCPDVKAIYRRPSFDKYGEANRGADGTQLWDLVLLPLKRHADWVGKGYVYVTLASNGDLADGGVLRSLKARGLDPRAYLNGPRKRVWEPHLYLKHADAQAAQDVADLEALVKQFGPEAVTAIKRQTDPGFELPDALKGKGKGKGVAA